MLVLIRFYFFITEDERKNRNASSFTKFVYISNLFYRKFWKINWIKQKKTCVFRLKSKLNRKNNEDHPKINLSTCFCAFQKINWKLREKSKRCTFPIYVNYKNWKIKKVYQIRMDFEKIFRVIFGIKK